MGIVNVFYHFIDFDWYPIKLDFRSNLATHLFCLSLLCQYSENQNLNFGNS